MDLPKLILASASPRRRELLTWSGVDFNVFPVDVSEDVRPGEPVVDCVRRLAAIKAKAAAELHPTQWVLTADTVVTLDKKILGKPDDRVDAFSMLKSLAGRKHLVYTAFCLIHFNNRVKHLDHVSTEVEFRELSDADINRYIESGEVWDKAGAYAIQGRGGALVNKIRGSYTNVIGLPMQEVMDVLKKAGLARV